MCVCLSILPFLPTSLSQTPCQLAKNLLANANHDSEGRSFEENEILPNP